MTLREMLDAVLLEAGMDTETQYVSSQDDAVKRLVSLANRAADYLSSGYDWQAMRDTYEFTLTTSTTYPLPDNFRAVVPDTAYANSYYDPVDIVTDPGAWRYYQVNGVSTGPRYRIRFLGGNLEVNQPNENDTISFEYVTNAPVLPTAGSTRKRRFTEDTDTWLLDDDMLITDILWRYKRLIGQPDYAEAKIDATRRKIIAQGQEGGQKTLMGGEYAEPGGNPYTPLWVNNP